MFNLLRNYSYDYNFRYDYSDMLPNVDSEIAGIAVIVSLVVAIIVYFAFLSKRNTGRFTGFAGWLYEVLNFGKLIIEALLKICYMFISLYVTIISIVHMTESFGDGLLMLIVYNIVIRIAYECILMIVMIFSNIKDINSKLKDQNNDNNTMNGGRTNCMPPQQSYGQAPYAHQPNSQHVMNRQPMGMQQPTGTQQPMGMQKPMGTQQPIGMQQPMGTQQPIGMQQPMGTQQPTEMHQSLNNHYQGSTGSAFQPVNQNPEKSQVNSNQEELPKVQNVKYCMKCGNVVEQDDMFCQNCGTKVVE